MISLDAFTFNGYAAGNTIQCLFLWRAVITSIMPPPIHPISSCPLSYHLLFANHQTQ
jgi:hypothetical protein